VAVIPEGPYVIPIFSPAAAHETSLQPHGFILDLLGFHGEGACVSTSSLSSGSAVFSSLEDPRSSKDREPTVQGSRRVAHHPCTERRKSARPLARIPHGTAEQPVEIIVVDDHSQDATAEVARRRGATVVFSDPLPDGWVGKTWACCKAPTCQRKAFHVS